MTDSRALLLYDLMYIPYDIIIYEYVLYTSVYIYIYVYILRVHAQVKYVFRR